MATREEELARRAKNRNLTEVTSTVTPGTEFFRETTAPTAEVTPVIPELPTEEELFEAVPRDEISELEDTIKETQRRQQDEDKARRAETVRLAEQQAKEITEIESQQRGLDVSGVRASQAAITASTAQGREGIVSTTNRFIGQEFNKRTNTQLNIAGRQLALARDKRATALTDLRDAQRRADETDILRAQQDVIRADTLRQQAENQAANIEAEAFSEAMDFLGASDGGIFEGMTIGDVTGLFGIPAANAASLIQLDKRKAALDAASPEFRLKQAQINKAMSEAKVAGLTTQQKNFVFAQGLTGADRDQFLNFAGQNPTFGFTKVGDTLYSTNPDTGEVNLVVGESPIGGIQPSGQLATAQIAGRSVTLDSGALVTFQGAYASMQNEIGDVPFQSKETFSARELSTQKKIYGKGRTIDELLASGEYTPEEAALMAQPGLAQTSWTLESKHLDGLAIDFNFEGKNIDYINDVERIMKRNGWDRPIPGEDPGHFIFNGKPIDTQLSAQIRAFASSVSGLGSAGERETLAKDIETEIASGRATTPQEAKLNLGLITTEDKEVKKRISGDLKVIKKDTTEIIRNVRNIEALSKLEGGIGDTAAITAFLKTIDPGSVARESEVAGVESARGIIESARTVFAKAKTGDRLSPLQREQLTETATILGQLANEKLYEQLIQGKAELEARGVVATPISEFELQRLERAIGPERVNLIKQESGIAVDEPVNTMTKFGFEDIDNETLINEF